MFIMRLFDAGLSTPEIMKLAGHEQMSTTEQYARAGQQGAIDAYHKADTNFGTEE